MRVINVHDAKTHLSSLLVQVQAGEEIIIARAGKPVARLCRVDETSEKRVLGRDEGLFEVPDDFDAPLPGELIDLFES
jgi:prevent-host-death family protein